MKKTRLPLLLGLLSFFAIFHHSYANEDGAKDEAAKLATQQMCDRMFADLSRSGPAPGYIYEEDLMAWLTAHVGSEILETRVVPTYECQHCGRLNLTKSSAGKAVDCPGCNEPIPDDAEVWERTIGGRVVIYAKSILYSGPKRLAPKLNIRVTCPYCDQGTPLAANCTHCGGNLDEAINKPGKALGQREIELDPESISGFVAQKPKPVLAAPNQETPAKSLQGIALDALRPASPRRAYLLATAASALIFFSGLQAYDYALQPPAPVATKTVRAKITAKRWRQDVNINKPSLDKQGWVLHKSLVAPRSDEDAAVVHSPEIPAEFRGNTAQWQIDAKPMQYAIDFNVRGKVVTAEDVSELDFKSGEVGDEVDLVFTDATNVLVNILPR